MSFRSASSRLKSNKDADMVRPTGNGGTAHADGEPSDTGAVRALELAHAAKCNLGTTWGVGESGVRASAL